VDTDPAANEWTPAQRDVLARLRGQGDGRPHFDPDLRDRIRDRLENELASVASDLGPEVLWISKRALARVHTCEAHQVAVATSPFSWSVPAARGVVAHKAVELSVHMRGEPTPLDLVDAAIGRLEEEPDGMGDFLRALPETERAELRASVNDVVAKFRELWPPLRRHWVPTTESALRLELCDGHVVLSGKVDLTLGQARGQRAGKLVVDLKSGGSTPAHADDLRFYALVETVRVGVPPFRLATYYLDGGAFHTEDVNEGVLEAALRRTIAGARNLADLQLGLRSPAVTPNPACAWCPARADCEGAVRWAERDLEHERAL
jgi:hypothetical protein